MAQVGCFKFVKIAWVYMNFLEAGQNTHSCCESEMEWRSTAEPLPGRGLTELVPVLRQTMLSRCSLTRSRHGSHQLTF